MKIFGNDAASVAGGGKLILAACSICGILVAANVAYADARVITGTPRCPSNNIIFEHPIGATAPVRVTVTAQDFCPGINSTLARFDFEDVLDGSSEKQVPDGSAAMKRFKLQPGDKVRLDCQGTGVKDCCAYSVITK